MKYYRITAALFFFLLSLKLAYSTGFHDFKPNHSELYFAQIHKEITLDFPESEPNPVPFTPKSIQNESPPIIEPPIQEKKEKIIQKTPQKTAFAIFQRKEATLANLEKKDNVPNFYRGIYISNRTTRQKNKFSELLENADKYKINTFVIDVQPFAISTELIDDLVTKGIHPVARVVIFEGGLGTAIPQKSHMEKLKKHMENACKSGFEEIQFDYIRFQDGVKVNLTIKQRYQKITNIIEELKGYVSNCSHKINFGADIFGRIPFNENDIIGQRVENFSETLDIIYPMLYPSHFYGQPKRIKDPYQTVYDGVIESLNKAKKGTRIIPYIQGFGMSVRASGLKLPDYIKAQVKASYDSKSNGFIVWNAFNDYTDTFKALENLDMEKKGIIASQVETNSSK